MARTAVMKVWNVELGLAIHIKTPNGKYVVIDLGASKEVSPAVELNKIMKYEPGSYVQYMILTHPHKDHFDDILHVNLVHPRVLCRVKDYSEEEIMQGAGNEKEKFQAYCKFVNEYTSGVSDVDEDNPRKGSAMGGLFVTTFQAKKCDKENINNFSKVAILELGNAKIVVCGDPEIKALTELMGNNEFREKVKNSWVLVAPHHGRESSFLPEFVSLVNPYLTIVSDTSKCATSAADKYCSKSRGWMVTDKSSGQRDKRWCLTTRKDGNIEVTFGESDDAKYSGHLDVSINC